MSITAEDEISLLYALGRGRRNAIIPSEEAEKVIIV